MARFLIADDSLLSRKMLEKIITDFGHTVVGESKDGEETVQMYEALKPDVLTLDITMPIMNGIECLEKIIGKYPEAKVLIVSAIGKSSMVLQAMKNGAKYYVTKPLDEKKVIEAISITIADNNPPPDKSAFY